MFSRKSRRRLLVLFNRLDWSSRATFLTLTFHSSPSVAESNKAFKRFRMWLGRAYPGASAVWRRELQPKRGAIHFHLICFNLPFVPQRSLQAIWTRCTGEDRSIVHVTLLKSRLHGMKYVSKYVAKLPEDEGITSLEISPYQHAASKPSIGRCWGLVNADALPFCPAQVICLPDSEDAAMVWVAAAEATNGKCGQNEHVCLVFTDDAARMMAYIKRTRRFWEMDVATEGKICYDVHQRPLEAMLSSE